jgi:hypothetical protein
LFEKCLTGRASTALIEQVFALVEERSELLPELRLVVGDEGFSTARVPGERASRPRRRRSIERVGSALAAVAILACALVGGGVAVARLAERWLGAPGAARSVVVKPGQSLWSLAEEVDPGRDPRRVVGLLRAELGTDVIHPGEVVRVPR